MSRQLPRSMTEFLAFREGCDFTETFERGQAFRARTDDIIISPFPKCGTTWIQQIAHSLRTRGSMDFDEITRVAPWITMAHFIGLDLDAPQPPPRLFKDHLRYDLIPREARYIIPVRHPKDALVSFFRYFEGVFFELGSVTFAELYDGFLSSWSYPEHFISWWEQRENDNVLFLCFEDMIQDREPAVRAIARFMEIELDDELFEIVMRQSSFEFMKAHSDKFEARLVLEGWQRN